MSRVHGEVIAAKSSWGVRSHGRFIGFAVYDAESPSRLHIPPASGPITVPFAHAIVSIEVRHRRYVFEVHGGAAPGWVEGWASSPKDLSDLPLDPQETEPPWSDLTWSSRRGEPLRWYQTLVAMCEPRFGTPPSERIPSNSELAQRLGVSQGVIENHYLDQLRRHFGFDKFDAQSRQAAVVIAIGQGLVRRRDVERLLR